MDEGRPGKERCWGSDSAPLAWPLVKQAGHGLGGARIDDWSPVSSKRGCRPGVARARNRRHLVQQRLDAGKQASKQASKQTSTDEIAAGASFLARTRLAGLLGPVTRLLTHNTIWTSMKKKKTTTTTKKKKKKKKKKTKTKTKTKNDTTSQGSKERVICWLVDSS
ncbi:uncharacterized protein ARB_03068 [Trichophyton benhamiae CBS 112371]|uniref:Uncharacterized protein n=1 Tax=Arthroderma benhamiae (strain ATCC MYA-4681 / CBS 112371) TaxID=663331 RepID=D4B3M9_ARTBC|nr:uncharacterized protein ARB_03068 [Trichophyton benhamiae CBS 112371]EFE29727.1 hypothetical protein ARB_03068 [Trichophyton benhamiae CBS 112371]